MTKLFLAGLAVTILATPATAQMRGFEGDMTRAQMEQFARTGMARIDANGDGIITQEELNTAVELMSAMGAPAAAGDRLKTLFASLAVEGQIKIDDVVEIQLAEFDKADVNRDGTLTRRERRAAAAR